jgi:hypothetical protein
VIHRLAILKSNGRANACVLRGAESEVREVAKARET